MNKVGYACINLTLAEVGYSVNRTLRQDKFLSPDGPKLVAEKAIQNLIALEKIVEWNAANGFNFYRMSSSMFPWKGKYKLSSLPRFNEILELLERIGKIATHHKIRLTFHPEHFCILGSQKYHVAEDAISILDSHSEILDYMGFAPSFWNKINIHIGSAQGGREEMCKRWIAGWKKLSENAKKRIVVENDDKPNLYSTEFLYKHIHQEIGIPITFDTLHHMVGPTSALSMEESGKLAASTWPAGMSIFHYSSCAKKFEDPNAKYNQHAFWIYENLDDFGTDSWIMTECKGKELAIIDYKNNGPRKQLIE